MTAREMLAEVLRRAVLTQRERESFEDMWDRIHRFDRCSDKQRAWIEKVYFGQKLDREETTAKRRVVMPNWQKNERESRPVASANAPPAITPMATVPVATVPVTSVQTGSATDNGIVRTNARQIRQRRQSGTFAIPTPQTNAQGVRVGYINYPGVQAVTLVTNLLDLETVCPRIEPGSKQYEKIADFFQNGGVVLKVKPIDRLKPAALPNRPGCLVA